jgi:hypothetical protein
VSFAAIALCVASQRVFVVVYFVMTQSGNFWIHLRKRLKTLFLPLIRGILDGDAV